ncbi:hypothetical protein TI04_04670 [Achromatium sp. WMS2]|nr:hypothetical protein TI04_04670 [Achromatium sp. WMS2]
MYYKIIPVTDYEQNCSVLWCNTTKDAVIVDPGGEIDLVLNTIQQLRVHPLSILLTHGHIDHVGGAKRLATILSIPIQGPHKDDFFWLQNIKQQSFKLGLFQADAEPFIPDAWLNHGDIINFGKEQLEVLHCPGHTAGHVAFFNRKDRLALVGDILFLGSVGRTDLPGGNHTILMQSITENLMSLGLDIQFISGHGPMSSFGAELQHNPFLKGMLIK